MRFSVATGSPLPCFAVRNQSSRSAFPLSSLKIATRAEVSKKPRDKGATAVALAASLCAILIHVEGPVVSQTWRAGSYPGRRAICSEVTGPGSSMAERSAKITAYPVLKVFRRYASFRVALGFAQPPRQFPRIPEQRFQPPAEGLYPSSHPPFPSLKIARCAEREFLVKSSRALARGVLA